MTHPLFHKQVDYLFAYLVGTISNILSKKDWQVSDYLLWDKPPSSNVMTSDDEFQSFGQNMAQVSRQRKPKRA